MARLEVVRNLMKAVLAEPNARAALGLIVESAREATRSRNALIALVDVEAGQLELSIGSGPDWKSREESIVLNVAMGRNEGITAHVAATGAAYVTDDVANVSAYYPLFESTRSELAAPIRDGHGKLIAVLNLESDQLSNFSEEDVEIAETIAAVAAIALERGLVRSREEALVEIGTAIDDVLTEDELMHEVIDVAERVLRFQACSIFLFDPRSQSYVLRASTGALKDRIGELSYAPNEGFTGWVCSSGEPILLDKPQGDPRWRGKFTEIPSEQIASFLAVPILIRGKSMGVIRALRRIPDNEFLDNRFDQDDLRLLQAIAEQTGVAVDNVRAFEKLLHAERMTAWGELSAKSSHMIGNRVFALKGDVNELEFQLRSDSPNLDELRKLQKGIEMNVTRLQELLQDFRDFVSATQLNRSVGNLNELVKETIEEVFPKRGTVELDLKLEPNLPMVGFDPRKLRLAISELIENSMSFFSEGTLEIETGIAEPALLKAAKLGAMQRFVKIVIADQGPGVDDDVKELIFKPFFTSRVKGMGLGLSIVQGIVEAHGGTVVEIGQAGVGAKFVVLLPISDRPIPGDT